MRIVSKIQGTREACIDRSESAVNADVEHVALKSFPAPKHLLSLAAPALELIRYSAVSALLERHRKHTIAFSSPL